MKNKYSKRSISNKQISTRSDPTQTRRLSIQVDPQTIISPNHIDFGTGSVNLDGYTPCLKPNVLLKSQKILKRDLLRCSNQRPSLLGSQTLQPPRIHRLPQQTHSVTSTSSTRSSPSEQRRRSLSVNSHTFYATIDRIGPWPDISISRLRSDGNNLIRPLKNFRASKNPRLFSPKFYAGLNDRTTTNFKFYPSTRTYMDEYRKQKGYLLIPDSTKKSIRHSSLSAASSSKQIEERSDDDQLSIVGTISGRQENLTPTNRSEISVSTVRGTTKTTEESLISHYNNHIPVISTMTNPINIFPPLPARNHNNHLRFMRPPQHHQTVPLPSITTSFPYIDHLNAIEKASLERKKSAKHHKSKLYFLDGRQKKRKSRHLFGAYSESEITSGPQNHLKLGTTSSSVLADIDPRPIIVVFKRRIGQK